MCYSFLIFLLLYALVFLLQLLKECHQIMEKIRLLSGRAQVWNNNVFQLYFPGVKFNLLPLRLVCGCPVFSFPFFPILCLHFLFLLKRYYLSLISSHAAFQTFLKFLKYQIQAKSLINFHHFFQYVHNLIYDLNNSKQEKLTALDLEIYVHSNVLDNVSHLHSNGCSFYSKLTCII